MTEIEKSLQTVLDKTVDSKKVFDVLKMDKKRARKEMNYVLLERIGRAVVKPIPLAKLQQIIQSL